MEMVNDRSAKWVLRFVAGGALAFLLAGQAVAHEEAAGLKLFNGKDLSGWSKYLEGRCPGEDPKAVFSVTNGILRISGEEWGGIVTAGSFHDYRLLVEYRWTGPAWGWKTEKAPDSGVLFHSFGEPGKSSHWMPSFEFNLMPGASGTVWLVGSDPEREQAFETEVAEEVQTDTTTGRGNRVFRSGGVPLRCSTRAPKGAPRCILAADIPKDWTDTPMTAVAVGESPRGDWNVAEVLCRGDSFECRHNGRTEVVGRKVTPTCGRIQVQSEGYGLEIRRIDLYPLEGAK